MNIQHIGILFQDYFENYFNEDHIIQNLTESNKECFVYHKGIYLSNIY